MGISYGAKRVKEAAQLWEPMAKYLIARKTAADAAAVVERDKQVAALQWEAERRTEALQWGAERRTEALKVALDHHAKALNTMNKGVFEGAVALDETNLGIYTEAFNRWRKTQLDYYSSVDMNPEEYGRNTITHLTPFFSSIFEGWAKEHPDGDPAALKWGKPNGVWGDVILRGNLDPSIEKDDAQAVWEKIWKSKFGDRKKGLLSGEGLIGSSSFAGVTAEALGAVPDFFTEFGEGAAELSKSIWEGKNYMTPLEGPYNWGDRTSREYLRELFGVESGDQTRSTTKPIITKGDFSGKYTPMGPFAASGLISGATDYMRGPFTSEAPSSQDIETLEETVKSLEEVESDAKKRVVSGESIVGGGVGGQSRDRGQDISQEAASFLAKLLEYMTAYGPEEARVILSEEFSQLSSKAKNELQSYLMTESEALA
jgi:hypothetical protein